MVRLNIANRPGLMHRPVAAVTDKTDETLVADVRVSTNKKNCTAAKNMLELRQLEVKSQPVEKPLDQTPTPHGVVA